MANQMHQQFLEILERSREPLIVLTSTATVDDFSSAYGIAHLLETLEKPVTIVTSGGLAPDSLSFYKKSFPVRGDLPNIRKLTLHVNAKNTKVDELSYRLEGDELQIHLLPKSGVWHEGDVRVSTDQYRYDVIIAIGAQELEHFGALYESYSDFFLATPIINIDHQISNDHFGQMNLVNVNVVASSQICYDLFQKIDASLLSEEVATFFLTGMISKTRSFKSDTVSPHTLKVAGDLIALGARREDIVENLYKTRSVETLRLWGRALARLKSDDSHSLVWTLLTRDDFARAGASEGALENVVEELMMSSPHTKVAAVFYEGIDKTISVVLHADRPHDALFLGAPFRASGTREEARLHLKKLDIVGAEKKVITHLRTQMKT
jgi:nanoRNase/pAp phosphatase (c-di-AMP/oligoRNAs hydrolase)